MAHNVSSELIERFNRERDQITAIDPLLKLQTIGLLMGVSLFTAWRLKTASEIKANPRGRVCQEIPSEIKTEIGELRKANFSERDIADRTGINRNKVQDILKELNIPKRQRNSPKSL